MIIDVLTIGADGTQSLGTREVPDSFGSVPQEITAPDPQADTDALLVDHEYRLVMLELGVTG